jgi:RNA polymerase sigma-70 factor (ECF subfamily)
LSTVDGAAWASSYLPGVKGADLSTADAAAWTSRYRPGVKEDFDRLYQATYQQVFGTLMMILRNPAAAEDATQEAYLRAFHDWKNWKQQAPAEGWIYRIALNVAFSHRRREQRHEVGEVIRRVGRPLDTDPTGTEHPDLIRELRALPPKHSAALVLRYLHGFTNREIAAASGVPERTIASRLAAGKALLRNRIAVGLIVAAAAICAVGAGETAISGSINPADWGSQLVQQAQKCAAAFVPSSHGIRDCLSTFAPQGLKQASTTNGNGQRVGDTPSSPTIQTDSLAGSMYGGGPANSNAWWRTTGIHPGSKPSTRPGGKPASHVGGGPFGTAGPPTSQRPKPHPGASSGPGNGKTKTHAHVTKPLRT